VRAAVVGHVEWVRFARVARVPEPGAIVTALDSWEEPGGGGADAAGELVRLGAEVDFFLAVGNDEVGAQARDALATLGCRVHAGVRDEAQRLAFTYLDSEGERTITLLGPKLHPRGSDPLPWDVLADVDAVYFTAGDAGALRAARQARALVATARELPTLVEAHVQLDALVRSGVDPSEAYESGLLELSSRRVDVRESRPLSQGDLRAGAYVCIQVADTGSGMTPEIKARIFDPFFTTRKVGEGTGLGLSVVHGIVADVGGAIDVADRAERGTLISVWLPIVGEAERVLPPIASDWPRGNGEAVMIVDDEQPLVELAEELLAGLGYEPVGYDSSEAALLAFEAAPQRFDAVLSDEMLPGMTGSEFAFKVRARRPELPIVLMSGNVSTALEARARDAGVRAVLHKPLALQELAECLSKFVSDKPQAAPDAHSEANPAPSPAPAPR